MGGGVLGFEGGDGLGQYPCRWPGLWVTVGSKRGRGYAGGQQGFMEVGSCLPTEAPCWGETGVV